MIVSDWFNHCLNLTDHMGEEHLEKIIAILDDMRGRVYKIENTNLSGGGLHFSEN